MARSKTQRNQPPALGSTPLHPTYYLPNQPPSQRQDRNEKILLSAVWAEVQDRLNQSLHNAVLLTLGKTEQRDQVSRPWDSQLRIANQASRPLPTDTPIAAVFDRDDINGKLLILGNPGAGKTTTLVDLAAALVQRANSDPTQPIPVLFNLSSWQDDKQTLKDWLLGELKLKYGVSPKLGQQWLEARTLLPLLDGLDELPPQRQEPAVQRINDWLQSGEGASQLVVCSRREEYELYATKLALNGAICLEPLTEAQLATYFATLGMEPLWDTVRHDPDFLELVRTPLLLSVSILANEAIDPVQWQRLTTAQARLDYLLDAYIVRQLHHPIDSRYYPPQKQPTPQQTRHWLTWLARQLETQSKDEFLVEEIDLQIVEGRKNILKLLLRHSDGIKTFEKVNFRFKPKSFLREFFSSLMRSIATYLLISTIVLMCQSIFLFTHRSHTSGEIIDLLVFPHLLILPFAIFAVLFSATIDGLASGLKDKISYRKKPNESILLSLKNSTTTFAAIFILSFLFFAIIFQGERLVLFYDSSDNLAEEIDSFRHLSYISLGGILISLILSFNIGFLIALSFGGMGVVQHLIIRITLFCLGCIPWNYARFLNHCTERLLLQRVGGRYRFIHRLVQERFAATGGHRL